MFFGYSLLERWNVTELVRMKPRFAS